MYMGFRFWVKTSKVPVFNLQVQWMKLNEQYQGYWFFQDETDDMGLHRALGYHQIRDPIRWAEAIDMYENNPKKFLFLMKSVTNNMIEENWTKEWDRPTPYWEQYRSWTCYYILVKQMYLQNLFDAGIEEIKIRDQIELPDDVSIWYAYRPGDAPSPNLVYNKISGAISRVKSWVS